MAAAFTSPSDLSVTRRRDGTHSRPSACSARRIGCSGGGIWKRDGTGWRRGATASQQFLAAGHPGERRGSVDRDDVV